MIGCIDAHRDQFGVEPVCRVLPDAGVPAAASTCHAARARPPSARAARDACLAAEIQRVYKDSDETYGARKVWLQLRREGIPAARCTTERLMRQVGLRGVRRGRRTRTTIRAGAASWPPDLVQRKLPGSGRTRLPKGGSPAPAASAWTGC